MDKKTKNIVLTLLLVVICLISLGVIFPDQMLSIMAFVLG